jgi:hypothetical protein
MARRKCIDIKESEKLHRFIETGQKLGRVENENATKDICCFDCRYSLSCSTACGIYKYKFQKCSKDFMCNNLCNLFDKDTHEKDKTQNA